MMDKETLEDIQKLLEVGIIVNDGVDKMANEGQEVLAGPAFKDVITHEGMTDVHMFLVNAKIFEKFMACLSQTLKACNT